MTSCTGATGSIWMTKNMKRNNIFDLPVLPGNTSTEIFETLLDGKVRIDRIVSTGQTTPEGEWYDQEKDEWVVLLQGEARLRLENAEILELVPGDAVFLSAHCRHRVEYTSKYPPCIWLAVHGDLKK